VTKPADGGCTYRRPLTSSASPMRWALISSRSWVIRPCLSGFTAGAAEIDRMLLFRNRLWGNDADRDAYLQVKLDLAKRTWRHVQHYADAKTAIMEQIIARATLHRCPDITGKPPDEPAPEPASG
jgi:GrpB protein